MLVLFEGPRSVGKSTTISWAAKQLTQRGFKTEVVKFERSSNPYKRMMEVMPDMANSGLDVIYLMDRGHITELVYTFYHSRSVEYTLEQVMELDRLLSTLDTLMVYMVCDPIILADRMENDEKESEGDIESILDLFQNAIELTTIQTAYVDTSLMSETDVKTFVSMIILHFIYMKKLYDMEAEDGN